MAQARQFEQLPVLNVDPALLEWGHSVTQAYTRAAQELALGQQKAKIASEGIATPTGGTVAVPSGGGVETADTRAAYKNAQQQRRVADRQRDEQEVKGPERHLSARCARWPEWSEEARCVHRRCPRS